VLLVYRSIIMDINELIIKMKTNIPTQMDLEFTSDIYYVEDQDNEITYNKYPYFTNAIRFPASVLANKKPNQLKVIFFNKDEFNMIMTGKNAQTSEERNENTNYNMKVFIELLMPTYYPVKQNYSFSYNNVIVKQPQNVGETESFFAKLLGQDKHKYSFLKKNNLIYTFIEIIWVNDVINNKTYRDLFKKLYDFENWRENQINNAKKENENIVAQFQEKKEKLFTDLKKEQAKIIDEYDAMIRKRDTKVPRTLVLGFINNLVDQENSNDIKKIIELFVDLKKNQIDAARINSPGTIFISQSINNLTGFNELFDSSRKYAYNNELIKYLSDLPAYNKYMETKREDIPQQFDKETYDSLKKIRDIERIYNLIKGFRSPVTNEDRNNVKNYRISSNSALQKLINEYGLDKDVNKIIKEIGEFLMNVLENKKKKPTFDSSYLDLGLVSEITNPYASSEKAKEDDKSNPKRYFSADFQCAFVEGKLNKDLIKIINCDYRNNQATRTFKRLKNKSRNEYIVNTAKQNLLDVTQMAKNIESKKKTRRQKGGFKLKRSTRRHK